MIEDEHNRRTYELIAKSEEYALRAPKIPRESVDVFARDIPNGNYGRSAEVIDTLRRYALLQRKLASFEDLTFSDEFIRQLPEGLRVRVGENLAAGVPLSRLEITTTDKVLLAQLLVADALTAALTESYVEIWVNVEIQQELGRFGVNVEKGLIRVDYASLPLVVRCYLISVMEQQEYQVSQILAAKKRFPDGVSLFSMEMLFGGKTQRVNFSSLSDFDAQYAAARDVLNNPGLAFFTELITPNSELLEVLEQDDVLSESIEPDLDVDRDIDAQEYDDNHQENRRPVNLESAAKGDWWRPDMTGRNDFETRKLVAEHLRAQYAGKTIFEIFEATSPQEEQEILAAFWRRPEGRRIDFGDEGWIQSEIYLMSDGRIQLHTRDVHDSDAETDKADVTISLETEEDVAIFDQTVKWIREEREKMAAVRRLWEAAGLDDDLLVEVTLLMRLKFSLDKSVESEIKALPAWLLGSLEAELRQYRELPLIYFRERSIDQSFLASLFDEPQRSSNLLKAQFIEGESTLTRYQGLLRTPEELLADLGLNVFATVREIKAAYRRIAKETEAIHTKPESNFDPKIWKELNDLFIKATRAYKILTLRRNPAKERISALGMLSAFFDADE